MFYCNLCAGNFNAQEYVSHKGDCIRKRIKDLQKRFRDSHWKAHVERVLADMKYEERKPLTSRAKQAEERDWLARERSSL